MRVYQLQNKNDPDYEATIYTALEWAIRDLENTLENLDVGCHVQFTITALEMTQEEFDALPEIER